MSAPQRTALSLVERGWPAARRLSIRLAQKNIATVHVVKGALPRNVIEMITPYPGMRVTGMPKALFWPAVWLRAVAESARGRLAIVITDNERAQRRVAAWPGINPDTVVLAKPASAADELWIGGRLVSAEELPQ